MPPLLTPLAAGLFALAGSAAPPPPVFVPLPQAEAWKVLPRKNPDLPAWALTLAGSLPRGTAKLLELDDFHRTQNPLGPVVRAKLRWVAADANGCEYGRRYAAADLLTAGGTAADLAALKSPGTLPPADRAAVKFARKLSVAAYTVTDAEVAELSGHFGHKTVVAMVHTLAYANFQDRLLLGLRVAVEPAGPLPPVGVAFALPPAPKRAPGRPAVAAKGEAKSGKPTPFVWADGGLDLAGRLDGQKNRTAARVPMVEASQLAGLPPAARDQAGKVVWSNISMGYQPAMTGAWFASMAAAQEDCRFDRTMSNSVFWVVTRNNQCFY